MGNSQGTEEAAKCGYRVLGVQPNSPASKVGLVSFFDFIVAADGEFSMAASVSCFENGWRDPHDGPMPVLSVHSSRFEHYGSSVKEV